MSQNLRKDQTARTHPGLGRDFYLFLQKRNLFCFSNIPFLFWIVFGFILRILLLFADPMLSEDVYRFLWDGLLLSEGTSPFSFLPQDFSLSNANPDTSALSTELLIEMNSLKFYSVYPPVLQFLFYVSAKGMVFFQNVFVGILIWKCILLGSEFGILRFLCKILKEKRLSFHKSLIYWLNPLVLLEISGNAHPEAILIFFLTGAVWHLFRWTQKERTNDFILHYIFLIFGILTKVTPLILVPYVVRILLHKKQSFLVLKFFLLPAFVVSAGIYLFPDSVLKQRTSGIGVFFQLFEFNGSVYYILREFLRTIGENFYASGKICAGTAFVSILLYSFWKKKKTGFRNLFQSAETIYLIFLILSTTVHPWYILPLLVFCIFSGNFYPIVWSFSIFVSYSAYSAFPYRDSFFWLGIEYGSLFLFLHIDSKPNSLRKQKEGIL
nr:glycosyltransferase family 39 protein [Leptospira weilii]